MNKKGKVVPCCVCVLKSLRAAAPIEREGQEKA